MKSHARVLQRSPICVHVKSYLQLFGLELEKMRLQGIYSYAYPLVSV